MTTFVRRRAWIETGLRGLSLAIVFLAGLEGAVRLHDTVRWHAPLIGPYSHAQLLLVDSLGVRNRPGSRFEKWSVNNEGFRGPEISRAPGPNVIRVGVLGASETFGLFESEGSEYPARLGTLLDSIVPGRYEVVNLAIPGMGIPAMASYYTDFVARIEPDVVLIYPSPSFYLSEEPPRSVDLSAQPPIRAEARQGAGATLALGLQSFRFVPKGRSAVKRAVPLRWQRAVKEWKVKGVRSTHAADWVWHAVPEERMALFQDHLDKLVQTISGDGVHVILVTHTNRFRKNHQSLTSEDRYHLAAIVALFPRATPDVVTDVDSAANEAIRAVARKHGIRVIEAEDRIPPSGEYFGDYAHFTDAGAAAMAGILANGVVAHCGDSGRACRRR
jgi:hypothetical protein